MYCSKCKKNTPSADVVTLQTTNNRWRLKSKCTICGVEKSTFISKPMVEAIELHRPTVTRFQKRRIITLGIDDLWAADLVIMDRYKIENDGYKYMLNVIDTFSKYAWSEPLLTKSGSDVTEAFKQIVKNALQVGHVTPNLLHTDKGREFENKDFKQMLCKIGIKMYHTENEEKSSIVERFNRTLNEKMKVQFEVRKSFRWIDILQTILKDYNNSVHRTIGMAPIQVTKSNEPKLQRIYAARDLPAVKPRLTVGDRVRITRKKDMFTSKYMRNWTTEIFTISQVIKTAPVTYKIKDRSGEEIIGSFYERELQKTAM